MRVAVARLINVKKSGMRRSVVMSEVIAPLSLVVTLDAANSGLLDGVVRRSMAN